jgi:lysophospholipase L1-like esterase
MADDSSTGGNIGGNTGDNWVGIWGASPQPAAPADLPPEPFTRDGLVLADATLRQTLRVTADTGLIRLRITNAFGDAPLHVGRVCVALPEQGKAGVAEIEAGTARELTFAGQAATVVPPGAETASDPLDFTVTAGANVTVTLWLPDGVRSVTTHAGSRTTSWAASGDHVTDGALPAAEPVDHWYFLSGVDAQPVATMDSATATAVCLGDSLTDGRGSTTNGNDRWPDQLLDRLRAEGKPVAFVNQGIGGNRVLNEGLGPAILSRLDRDVLAVPGVRWLIVYAGVNDIGTADATSEAQQQVAADLCGAYENIALKARAAGLMVYGATLTPFGGNDPYDDPEGRREAARQSVNAWIRAGGAFDAVLDFDAAVRHPGAKRRLAERFDEGDHLHLSPAGYQSLAAAVPSEIFQ